MAKASSAKANSQAAPGRLEIVRAFLNTWWIPNDTREPADELVSLEAMRQFYGAWFGGEGAHPQVPIAPDQVQRLRADLRDALGARDVSVLNEWLARQPVEVRLALDEEGVPSLRYAPSERATCQLCADILALVMEAIMRSTWMRLKACPDCQWVFYDHTKNSNKVWCLMTASGPQGRSCGSIAKVRRFRQRQKAIAANAV